MVRRLFATFALLFIAAGAAFPQQSDSKLIAVNVDATDPRIQQMLPKLHEEAAKVVEESARNVRASIVIGSSSVAAEQARQKSADYLLRIDLSLQSQVAVPSSGGPYNGPATTADVRVGQIPYGITHSRCPDLLQGAFTFSYTVISLTGKNIELHDSHTMREIEYPLGPQLECLTRISTQAVRVGASAVVKKLKSKKGL